MQLKEENQLNADPSVYIQAMIIKKFILIGKEMIPSHSPPAKFMPNLVEIAIPCGSAILDSVTYHFQIEKQIGSLMKVNITSPANA